MINFVVYCILFIACFMGMEAEEAEEATLEEYFQGNRDFYSKELKETKELLVAATVMVKESQDL